MNINFQSLIDNESLLFLQNSIVDQAEVSKALKIFETWLNAYTDKEFKLRVMCKEIVSKNPDLSGLSIAVAISQGVKFLSDLGIAEHRFLFKNEYYNDLTDLPDIDDEDINNIETVIILNRNDNEQNK